ncbi:sigma-70 family RNA polymerase sigma factor [Flavobacterium sp.]|uniref:RNA polymerase sigma factor n=1 Tax=Flavobacterium sp. TaxID=239 RepID=UPI002602659F|nr:sigma-70 family RNA polymerase sigma factor [Flavobacterium sp.]MDD2986892.1 sigma-70 family RNA polymerase sigma factor [Flavobacterium sp.]
MQVENQPIEQLILSCQQQNQAAQFEVYRRYSQAMYAIAYRIVKDEYFAEDVMQEGFLKAFLKINDFKNEVTFGAWLKRIIINYSIDFQKKNNRYQWDDFEDVSFKIVEEPTIETDYSQLKVKEVLLALQSLKENYRIILTLMLIEGYDYEEVSAILNISYANCRTQYSRAKEQLKKKLETRKNEKA